MAQDRNARRRPGDSRSASGRSKPRPRPRPTPPVDDWNDSDYEDAGAWGRWRHKRKVRRRRRKARVAAMTRPRRYLRRTLIAGTWVLGLFAALLGAGSGVFDALTDVPRPEDLALPQVATIQYSDGSTLMKVGSVDRTIVSLNEVPKSVRYAVLAAEDRNFYQDSAVSFRGTIRAAWQDVTGGDTQGGSGVTQQYVKNAYLSNAPTLSRKLKELMIAVKLSREYSKDQILGFYLNTVYFGRGAYGVQAAAHVFFGKDVADLSVGQGAVLAAQLRAPSYYDPAAHLAAAKSRWTYVLDGMVATHHLTATQEAAMAYPKALPFKGTGLGATGWKFLLKNKVLAELQAHGISADEVAAKGLTIRTTIDKKAQDAALHAISDNFDQLSKKQQNLKNALVAVRPDDGAVLAYYGGSGPDVKGYDGKVDYNDYAGNGFRPPGSSFKPYTLATALTQTVKQTSGVVHYTIKSKTDGSFCKIIEGTKICNDPGDESVSGKHVSLDDAMKFSLNTSFDELASEVGPDQVAKTAHSMGVADKDPRGHQTLADASGHTAFGIGIGDYPVSVLDQANGYATLADGGEQHDAYLVSKATSSDGSTVYTHHTDGTQAIDKRVANDVTLSLKPVAAYSDAALANDRVSASKTGTAGIGGKSKDNSDAWMVGYTPQVSAAVWVGSGYSKPIYTQSGNPLYGKDLPARTWKSFMDEYLHGAKKLPLAKTQQVGEDGKKPAPEPSYTAPAYTPGPPSTQQDEPTREAPSTQEQPPPTTHSAPPPTIPPPTQPSAPPSATCTPTILDPCN